MTLKQPRVEHTEIPNAKITFCGEAPGTDEVYRGQGFVGKSGELLWAMALIADIQPHQVNRTNVIKIQPLGNNFTRWRITNEVVYRTFLQELRQELSVSRPNIVVAVGNEALEALCGVHGIHKYRGSILESTLVPGLKVVPILHPASLLKKDVEDEDTAIRKKWQGYWITCQDLKRVRRESLSNKLTWLTWSSQVLSGWNAVEAIEKIQDHEIYSIDIEVRGGSIACFSIATRRENTYHALCVPIQDTDGPHASVDDEHVVWLALEDLFQRNPNIVGQHLNFDLDWLIRQGIIPSGVWLDTRIAHAVLYPELPHKLEFLASLYCDYYYYKPASKTWFNTAPNEALWAYNMTDAVLTLDIAYKLEKELVQRGLWNLWWVHYRQDLALALEMQMRGLPVDLDARDKLIDQYADALKTSQSEIAVLAGNDFNSRSSKQTKQLIYQTLKLPIQHNRNTRKPTTDARALKHLALRYPNVPVLALIVADRELRKITSSYLRLKLESKASNYVLGGQWNPFGTESGRFSCSASPQGYGTNLQTIPEEERIMLRAPEGRVWVCVDLAQVEARIVAWLANCESQKEIFCDPSRSIHKENCHRIYHVPLESVDKKSEVYRKAKVSVHGANYGMGVERFSVENNIPYAEAKPLLVAYRQLYWQIPQWHCQVAGILKHWGSLTNPFGLTRVFYEALGAMAILKGSLPETCLKDAISWVPQTVPPFIISQAMHKIAQRLNDVWFHAHTHDGFWSSVPIDQLDESVIVMDEYLDVPVPIGNDFVHIPWEWSTGLTLGELTPWRKT